MNSKSNSMKTPFSIFFVVVVLVTAKAQVPVFNSYPTAQPTVYLDFDGQYVQGTSWNWSGPINAQPAALSATQITEIYNRVAEDFGIFNLNVTTDSTVFYAAPVCSRIRIIVTPTSQWYGLVGGVSYVGSFSWGDDSPGWVFSNLLGNDVKRIAEAVSHETGHTLGLHHQSKFDASCNKTTEYNGGQGSGEIGWAPIMGVGYYKNLTTWYYGPNTMGCTSFQSDIDTIAGSSNNIGLRSDDHQDSHATASPVSMGLAFSVSGIINNSTDIDVFKFQLISSNNFRLSAVPHNVGLNNAGANVDIEVVLLNEHVDTIGRYNPANLLNVGIDTNLTAGIYYLAVNGIANTNLSEYGSLGFYNLSASIHHVLPVHRFTLKGDLHSGKHDLYWSYGSDENIKETHVEYSTDGIHFGYLANLVSDARTFSWSPLGTNPVYYRVKLIMSADERSYYSNIIKVGQSSARKPIEVYNHFITDEIRINANDNYSYQLFDETGRLIQRGVLIQGSNQIDVSRSTKGILLLRVQNKNITHIEKLIKR